MCPGTAVCFAITLPPEEENPDPRRPDDIGLELRPSVSGMGFHMRDRQSAAMDNSLFNLVFLHLKRCLGQRAPG
ncbi:MAG: hypothetical protein AAF492_24505 [Verrucomicrobiota bacterium]